MKVPIIIIFGWIMMMMKAGSCQSSSSDATTGSVASNHMLVMMMTNATNFTICSTKEWMDHPMLCHILYRAENDLSNLVQEMYNWAQANKLLVSLPNNEEDSTKESWNTTTTTITTDESSRYLRTNRSSSVQLHQNPQLPVVFAHGMGDSCYNEGFISITKLVSKLLDDVYVVCIPTGSSQEEDTKNGFLLSMDASVEIFAQGVQNDPQLQNGFHAIGFSQGNNIIRGYIAKHNNPTVHTFISVNGVNAGTGAVPYCIPKQEQEQQQQQQPNDDKDITLGWSSICNYMMEIASNRAYTEFVQEHSFQANYWRDPRKSARQAYEQYCQLAKWNNEVTGSINTTLNDNYAKTQQFVWVLASDDKMVWPKEGEHWGSPNSNVDDPFSAPILSRHESDWYVRDLFGLRTAEEAGKNKYETFIGDHLQFTKEDLERWVVTYFKQSNDDENLVQQ